MSTSVLAVDIGGTKLETALVLPDGSIVPGSRQRRLTGQQSSRLQIADRLADAIATSIAHAGDAPVSGVGIGSAGPVDLTQGRIRPHNLPVLHSLPLVDLVESVAQAPATLRLDGTCIALAEHWLGAARQARSSMSMVVSTGVGGGIIVDGRLLTGRSGNAGHIGQTHVGITTSADPENSTLEAAASGPSTVLWAQERGWSGRSGEDLAADVRSGDPVAEAATRRSAEFVGQAIASATTLLDLEVVALGGGFVNVRADYLDLVQRSARRNAILEFARDVDIRLSGLGGDGPLLGAAALHYCAELIQPMLPAPAAL